MSLFVPNDYEELIHHKIQQVNLEVIICIDNTTLGKATGGTRFYPYASYEKAEQDVCRLARGMTYKTAMLYPDFHIGGGKAVIIDDPNKIKTDHLLREYGAIIENLNGKFETGEDSGMTVQDVEKMHTRFARGLSTSHGGGGNPAVLTALGCLYGQRAAMQIKFGSRKHVPASGTPRTVVIQGVGEVGFRLGRLVRENGGHVIACDTRDDMCARAKAVLQAEIVDPEKIYEVPGDIFAPCAFGGTINNETIPLLQCPIIAGSANNQLKDPEQDGILLIERDILYAPDFVINAGGLILIACEEGVRYNELKAKRCTESIYGRLEHIFYMSNQMRISTQQIAEEHCKQILASVAKMRILS